MARAPRPPQQRGLFEPAPAPESPKRVPRGRGELAPAPVSPELGAIAAQLPTDLRMGTSSWSFPGWRGIVYDGAASQAELARTGLAAYARHPLLRAVGVDRTYYAPVTAAVLAEYAGQVPEDFRFLVKAASLVTDPVIRGERGAPGSANERFLDAGFATEFCVAPFVEGLGTKAGVLLFQFPPLGRELARRPEAFVERLERFLRQLPAGPPYAVEVRDRELLGPAYGAALTAAGVAHCVSLHPRLPNVAAQRRFVDAVAAGPLVVRWMLHSGFGYEQAREQYAPFDRIVDEDLASRAAVAELILDHLELRRPVIFVANNKAEGSAPLTVFALARAVAARLETAAG
jgi:uncharacterized protein YecE (DUF72 family)